MREVMKVAVVLAVMVTVVAAKRMVTKRRESGSTRIKSEDLLVIVLPVLQRCEVCRDVRIVLSKCSLLGRGPR